MCSVTFRVSGEPLEASGVRTSTPDPLGSLFIKMPPEGGVFTDRDPNGSRVLLRTPEASKGSPENLKLTEHIQPDK